MNATSAQCAREILEAVPVVMQSIRSQIQQRRAEGLFLQQFRTLSYLSRVKDPSLSVVAEHLGHSLPAMSRLVNGLVEAGLVARREVSSNRRQVALALTARGRAKLEKVRAATRSHLAEVLEPLTVREQKTIVEAMQLLNRAFVSQLGGKRDGQS